MNVETGTGKPPESLLSLLLLLNRFQYGIWGVMTLTSSNLRSSYLTA